MTENKYDKIFDEESRITLSPEQEALREEIREILGSKRIEEIVKKDWATRVSSNFLFYTSRNLSLRGLAPPRFEDEEALKKIAPEFDRYQLARGVTDRVCLRITSFDENGNKVYSGEIGDQDHLCEEFIRNGIRIMSDKYFLSKGFTYDLLRREVVPLPIINPQKKVTAELLEELVTDYFVKPFSKV